MPRIHYIDKDTGDCSTEVFTKERITPLRKFVMSSTIEDMFLFLSSMGVQFSISANSTSPHKPFKYIAKIFIQQYDEDGHINTIIEYISTGNNSVKAVFANVLADFLSSEYVDYHEYANMRIRK